MSSSDRLSAGGALRKKSILFASSVIILAGLSSPSLAQIDLDPRHVDLDPRHLEKKAEQAGHDAIARAGQAGHDAIAGVGQAGHDAIAAGGNAVHQVIGDTATTVQKAGNDTITTVQKAGSDTLATYTKGWRDTAANGQKTFQDVVDADKATVRFFGRQLDAHGQSLRNARARLYDGKLVDAAWGLGTEHAQATEDNFFKATQESSLINQAGAAAASYYGGPAGAAAYAAWQTYKTTGDANLAIRAGIISGLQSEAGGAVNSMPTGTAGQVIEKSIAAGAIGGLAVAASGGDETAVKNGFIKSGGAVLVQSGDEHLKAYSPEAHDALEAAHCISAESVSCLANTRYARDAKNKILLDANGQPRIDTSAFDASKFSGPLTSPQVPPDIAQKIGALREISKIPNTQAVPILNNQWVVTWNFSPKKAASYGTPQVVLTYVGKSPPFKYQATYSKPKKPGAPPATPSLGGALYICHAPGGVNRPITVQAHGEGCVAIYHREAGQQTVWHSDHNPSECRSHIPAFVSSLRAKGLSCSTP